MDTSKTKRGYVIRHGSVYVRALPNKHGFHPSTDIITEARFFASANDATAWMAESSYGAGGWLHKAVVELYDPRPADPAQLAADVARELRKTHGIRSIVDGKCGVSIGGYYYDMVCKEHWTPLGPIAIAAEIKKLECARAMQDAGDT